MVVKGPESVQTLKLVGELEKASRNNNCNLWKVCANWISKPTRKRAQVNLYRLDKYALENATIVVPGKVLGIGNVSKKFSIAAFQMSREAEKKLQDAKCTVLTFKDVVEKNPKGTGLVLLV